MSSQLGTVKNSYSIRDSDLDHCDNLDEFSANLPTLQVAAVVLSLFFYELMQFSPCYVYPEVRYIAGIFMDMYSTYIIS